MSNGQSERREMTGAEMVVQALIDNGTLAKISEQYLGADYSTKEAVLSRIGSAE